MGLEINKRVERWRPLVAADLQLSGFPVPIILVLSLMQIESGGVAGNTNKKSGASGLMQVMPITLRSYNRNNPRYPVSLSELRSSSASSAAKQIRVGLWVLADYWIKAFNFLSSRLDPINPIDLACVADLFYFAGPGNVRPRLRKLSAPTMKNIYSRWTIKQWPTLVHWNNVFRLANNNDLRFEDSKISNWLSEEETTTPPADIAAVDPKMGLLLGLAVLGIASFYMGGKK